MATTTDFLGLSLPDGGEGIKRIMINGNFELIDAQLEKDAQAAAALGSMSRTFTATTEQEVREALQFAAEHPGCYLQMTLAAGLNAVVPTLYIRNATILIIGTQQDGANSNAIAFEQTTTTGNLHLQNTSLSLSNINVYGNSKSGGANSGVIRLEYGSSAFVNHCTFGQAEGSANMGINVEVREASRACVANSELRAMSVASNAACIAITGGGEAVIKTCTIAADSTVKNVARLEVGAQLNQIGSDYTIHRTSGHASVYFKDGILQQ